MTQGDVFSGGSSGLPPAPPPPQYPLGGGYVPQPAPPGPPAQRQGRVWLWVFVALAVVAGCIAVTFGMFGWGLVRFIKQVEFLGEVESELPETVSWVGDGRYVAIQLDGEDGEPFVVVWDSQEEVARDLFGYVLVATEPSSSVLWVVPATAEDGSDVAFEHGGGVGLRAVDTPPERLEAWDLESGEPPTSEVSAKWAPVPGPGEWVAYYEIDPLKGALPARLLFNTKQSHGEGHRAELPEGVVTFRPVGWSPSGEYVALEEMIQGDQVASSEWEDYYRDGVSDPVALDRRLVVVEAATGKTVTQVLLGDEVLSGVDWLDFADILVWYEGRPGDYPWLRALRPGSEPGDAWNVVGPDHVPDLESACCVVIHGRSRDGLVVTSAVGGYTEVWTVSEDGASHQGTLPSFSAADVDANGRFALLNYVWENDGEAMAPVLDIHDIHGGNRERAWTGRSRPSAEEWFE